ncbi:hypothetical protein [Mechercharimyces sp. CAU 1602]|uniref:hypothetical protein n=1 Tax=Mechercharimyces sp. CAU 1602 TaxID=2973933 RepID=UPI00216140F8|nr:hypothetical protein [Mechercharimyces sp. CAU 1602]MCS1351957.1 hypothetical protein [Mechercharimyces sp. CAU 1602]
MKKAIFLSVLISLSFSVWISYHQMINNEMIQLVKLESKIATPFVIPDQPELSNADLMYPLLLESAKEENVNLFRPARYLRPDEKLEIIKYVLFTRKTQFYDHIHVERGRELRTEESQQEGLFLSSMEKGEESQIGQIQYFDPRQLITIQPLATSYDHLPVTGRYFVEAEDETHVQQFLQTLSNKINVSVNKEKEGDEITFSPSNFQTKEAFIEPQEEYFKITDLSLMKKLQYIINIITILLFLYYILSLSKPIGILKIHGISNIYLWWRIVGRLLSVTFGIFACGSAVFAFVLTSPWTFISLMISQLVQAYLLLVALSVLLYGQYCFYQSKPNVKKQKRHPYYIPI